MKAILAALAVACLAGSAIAQDAAYVPQDTNQDGFQSFDELTAWYTGFITRLDVNKDGAISKSEFIVLYEPQLKDGSFAKADANHDGKLKGDEIAAMAAIIAQNDMDFCDSDKDGKISNIEERICTSGETIKP